MVLVLGLAMACVPALASVPLHALPAVVRVDALSVPFVVVIAAVGLASGTAESPSTLACAALACAALAATTGNPVLFGVGAATVLPMIRAGRGVALGVLAGAVATALLADGGGAAMGGWRLAILPAPVLLFATVLMGLSPRPLSGARHVRPAGAGDLAGFVLGCCLLVRMLVDWPAGRIGAPWGMGVGGIGLLLAMAGGARALTAGDAPRVLAGMLAAWGGVAMLLAGLAVVGRADDLPLLALGAARTLFLLPAGVGMAVLAAILTASHIAREAGPLVLARAGGLAALMPRAGATLALALAVACGLPPLAGFAVLWLLVQSLLALPRADGLAGEIPSLLALCGGGVVSGLLLLAGVRMGAILLLGRPRTPRCAAATDLPPARLMAVLSCLGVAGVVSVLPGLWLWLTRAAGWQVAALGAAPEGARPSLLWLSAAGGTGTFSPSGIVLLFGLCGGVVLVLSRLGGGLPARPAAAWTEGAPPSPPWMPFGDPATQVGPGLFVGRLDAVLGLTRLLRGAVRRLIGAVRRAGRWGAAINDRAAALTARHAMVLVLAWIVIASLVRIWAG
ncbi:hypothetical protein AA13595_2356 [Gluconacetobacter johannae DSM 13595]|nr:hypothetical protein [Gluconacetobacter johannae]GBQ88303.1 hypothetical protein AA13595_2356 [Gluconacetobacter johannae DSM 13595]